MEMAGERGCDMADGGINGHGSWTDGLEGGWNAYSIVRTDTRELIATVYREDIAYEIAKMLNERFGMPAIWMPDLVSGKRDADEQNRA